METIEQKVNECLKKAREYFGMDFPKPTIKFIDNLTHEGKPAFGLSDVTRDPENGGIGAGLGSGKIMVDSSLINDNKDKLIHVITHEMGHHVASLIYPDGHGDVWKIVMKDAFGYNDLSTQIN